MGGGSRDCQSLQTGCWEKCRKLSVFAAITTLWAVTVCHSVLKRFTIVNDGECACALSKLEADANKAILAGAQTPDFTVVILTMSRLGSLQRLVKSLLLTDYGEDVVDLTIRIDYPRQVHFLEAWNKTVKWVLTEVNWTSGSYNVEVADRNLGLRQAWFNAWSPAHEDARSIILEDDVEVSPLWYKWVREAYEAYGTRSDIAGFSLQRQMLVQFKGAPNKVPQNGHEPFLYKVVGSIGFVPFAKVWKSFTEWTVFALAHDVDVFIPHLWSSEWYDKSDQRMMWTQHFTYYINHYNLYTLYHILPENETLATDWREQGEHFGGSMGADFELADVSRKPIFPTTINKYDWKAELETPSKRRVMVMSDVTGYTFNQMKSLITLVKRVFDGDINLVVLNEKGTNVLNLEKKIGVNVTQISGKGERTHLISQWYSATCTSLFWMCLAIDLERVRFQLHPFSGLDVFYKDMFVYECGKMQDERNVNEAKACGIPITFAAQLREKPILDTVAIFGTSSAWKEFSFLIQTFPNCTGKIVLNIGIYAKLFNLSIHQMKQSCGNYKSFPFFTPLLGHGEKSILGNDFLTAPLISL